MKLRKLIIHNIASIEDATINFDAQPLSTSEVFLITGKTGAGKSTILDAICLALYANTPRMKNTLIEGKFIDVSNKKGQELTLKDPRQLMRRHTGEAFVQLTFLGSNGINYEATWEAFRAYKKVTGALQDKKWELRNLDSLNSLTRDKDIREEIAKAVGLDFDQFCRTTMLAQGEFTHFLNSEDADKAKILEKITGVDAYTKIGAKIFEITAEKKKAYVTEQTQVDSIVTLDEQQLAEERGKIVSLDMQLQTLSTEKTKTDQALQWLSDNKKYAETLAHASEEYTQVHEAIQSEDHLAEQRLVDQWNATVEVRTWQKNQCEEEKTAKKEQSHLEQYAADFAKLQGGQAFALEEEQKTQQTLDAVRANLDKEQVNVHIYDNVQTLAENLKRMDDCQKQITANKLSVKTFQKTLADEQALLSKTQNEEKVQVGLLGDAL